MSTFGSPVSVLITGANRGLGFGIVKQFLADPNVKYVIAGARNPSKAHELNDIKDDRLRVVQLDVESDESINSAFEEVSSIVGPAGLSILVNNAGVLYPYWTTHEINRATINQALNMNVTSTTIITQIFLPLLRKASVSVGGSGAAGAAVVIISSIWASISKNEEGSGKLGSLAHRMCKTALNQLGRTLARDLKEVGVLVVNFCPGWVKTDMGGDEAELTTEESSAALFHSIGRLTEEHSGGFFDRNLEPIPY